MTAYKATQEINIFLARDVEVEELRNENDHLEEENKHLKAQVSTEADIIYFFANT